MNETVEAVPMYKEKPSANIRVPDGSKVKISGFSDVGANDNVTVIIKGRLSGISDKTDPEWDKGKSLSIDLKSCQITGPAKNMSMDKAIKSARTKI